MQINLLKKMQILNKYEFSLGLESFDALGFESEEELNIEISKLIKIRTESEVKSEVNFI